MANFPNREESIASLATTMSNGYAAHIADFPSIDELALSGAIGQYNSAKTAQEQAAAAAKVATEAKNQKLDAMMNLMKEDLKLSEVDTDDDPEKLAYIGWGTKSPSTPIQPPLTATNLIAVFNGSSQLTLNWDKSVIDKDRPVYNYVIQRRDKIDGEYTGWFMVDMAYDNQASFIGQPANIEMDYRIIATNSAGNSVYSNTVPVVL